MIPARTPLLLERRKHRHWKRGKAKLIDRVRKKRKKLPPSYQATTRSMDLPTFTPNIGALKGSFGTTSVGGIMRHS